MVPFTPTDLNQTHIGRWLDEFESDCPDLHFDWSVSKRETC